MAKGLVLNPLGSSPIPSGYNGIWCDSNGHLIWVRDGYPSINITEIISSGSASASSNSVQFENNTGSTIPAFTPVSIDSLGDLSITDVSDLASTQGYVGVTAGAIAHGSSGVVVTTGRLQNISIGGPPGPSGTIWGQTSGVTPDLFNTKAIAFQLDPSLHGKTIQSIDVNINQPTIIGGGGAGAQIWVDLVNSSGGQPDMLSNIGSSSQIGLSSLSTSSMTTFMLPNVAIPSGPGPYFLVVSSSYDFSADPSIFVPKIVHDGSVGGQKSSDGTNFGPVGNNNVNRSFYGFATSAGADFGDAMYVGKTGVLTSTYPSIGTEGFSSGDYVIRVGVVSKNQVAPADKDLIINIQIVGQL